MATYKRLNGDYYIQPTGNVVIDGDTYANVTYANYFVGDGQFLSNVTANVGSATILQNGTSNVDIPVSNGNVTVGVNLVSNVLVISSTGAYVNGQEVLTANSQINGGTY